MKKLGAEFFGTFWLVFGGCGSAVLAAAFPDVGIGLLGVSLFLGRYPGPYWTPLRALREDPLALRLILNLRLPRILSAVVVGMTLSAAGAVFQMVFRNPLVDSGFLGVSAGASFGASLAIVALGGRGLDLRRLGGLRGLAERVRGLVVLVLARDGVLELAHAGPELLPQAGEPLGPEDEEHDHQDDGELQRSDRGHRVKRIAA